MVARSVTKNSRAMGQGRQPCNKYPLLRTTMPPKTEAPPWKRCQAKSCRGGVKARGTRNVDDLRATCSPGLRNHSRRDIEESGSRATSTERASKRRRAPARVIDEQARHGQRHQSRRGQCSCVTGMKPVMTTRPGVFSTPVRVETLLPYPIQQITCSSDQCAVT